MAARTVKIRHDEETRSKIQTSQLINRLEDHIFGRAPKMPATAVTAALGLLRKTLPDLSATQHSGDEGGPIEHVVKWKSNTSSTTSPESSSSNSTTEPSDGPA